MKNKHSNSFAEKFKSGLARYTDKFRRKRHLVDGSWKWNTRDVYEIHEAVKRFVREEACKRMGLPGNASPRLEMPVAGARSLIWFVREGNNRAVLRVYPVEAAGQGRFHRDASRLLAENQVNAPRLIHYSEDFERYRGVMLLEEFIEGETRDWNGFSERDIQSVAKQLACLHSIHNEHWGPLNAERSGDFFSAAMRRVENHLDIARQENLFAAGGSETEIRNWFQGWGEAFAGIRGYSLTHGDVHRNNGVFTPSGDYFLIDFSTFQWALAASDIVRNYHKLCGRDLQRIEAFNNAYFPRLSEADNHCVTIFIPFYEALTRLGAAAMRSKRLQKTAAHQESEADARRGEWSEQKRREAWHELLDLAKSKTIPSGNPR